MGGIVFSNLRKIRGKGLWCSIGCRNFSKVVLGGFTRRGETEGKKGEFESYTALWRSNLKFPTMVQVESTIANNPALGSSPRIFGLAVTEGATVLVEAKR